MDLDKLEQMRKPWCVLEPSIFCKGFWRYGGESHQNKGVAEKEKEREREEIMEKIKGKLRGVFIYFVLSSLSSHSLFLFY